MVSGVREREREKGGERKEGGRDREREGKRDGGRVSWLGFLSPVNNYGLYHV